MVLMKKIKSSLFGKVLFEAKVGNIAMDSILKIMFLSEKYAFFNCFKILMKSNVSEIKHFCA